MNTRRPAAAAVTVIAALLVLGHASGLGAQTPPVLSTVPTPAPGFVADPAQMSGLPLQVGDLPPGVVVVRVIRRSFAENVPGQQVELHRASGEIQARQTDVDGRAYFYGLAVGEVVHTRAVVGNEALGSQHFELPARGGVRLVLVAGAGTAAVPATSARQDEPRGFARANAAGIGFGSAFALGLAVMTGVFFWFVTRSVRQ